MLYDTHAFRREGIEVLRPVGRMGRGIVKRKAWIGLCAPGIAFIVLCCTYPVLKIIFQTFFDAEGNVSLAGYVEIFQMSFFSNTLLRTLKLSILTTVICAVVGLPVSFYISRMAAGRKSMAISLATFPLLTSAIVRSICWIVLLGKKGTINPVDVDIYKGEVVGFAGLLGSGRTELGRLLYGADKPDSGTYTLNGKKVNISDPYTALKNKIAYSTENRRDEGIIGDLTVRQNILIALQATRGMFKPIPKKEADAIVDKYMKELNVRPADPDRPIKNLSGGNQQKVLIGRWLATHPELLILDEPTRGIDIGAKAEIQQVVLDLASQGMGVVFISSELEEVVRLSDDIEVLKDRHKIAEIENDDTVSQATIVETIANTNVNTGKEA